MKVVITNKMADNRTEKRKLGDIGENIACHFLKKRGFEILDRNYSRKWGELDIVAKKDSIIHFVEVKSVSRELHTDAPLQVTHGTFKANGRGDNAGVPHVAGTESSPKPRDSYRPEDNLHPWKLKRLSRIIQSYMASKDIDSEFQLDIITVKIDMKLRKGRVEIIENVVI